MDDPDIQPTSETEAILDEGSQRLQESHQLMRELDRQLDRNQPSAGGDEVPEQA